MAAPVQYQVLHRRQEGHSQFLVRFQQCRLAVVAPNDFGHEGKAGVLAQGKLEQPVEHGRHLQAGRIALTKGLQAAVNAPPGGFRALPQRLQPGRLGDGEGVGQVLDGQARVGLQVGQVPVSGNLSLVQMQITRRGRGVQGAVAG